MHPFFRYGIGNSSQNSQLKKDGSSRGKSPTGSYEEEEDDVDEGSSSRRISIPSCQTTALHPIPIPPKRPMAVPVIKVDDHVVFCAKSNSKPCSNGNRKRLGPNKNNIILETLQNDLKGNN